ncbi:MAG: hypothetical protein LBT97_03265 [Planctomycetota bacterium]|nr:hypothetical protein [Planctomycetota bacterium]
MRDIFEYTATQVEEAIRLDPGQVLVNRFDGGPEWWSVIRPDDPNSFDSLARIEWSVADALEEDAQGVEGRRLA